MFDVVCVGNATLDVFIRMQGKVEKGNLLLPAGSKKEVESIFYSTGGGATNAAVGFRRLGLRSAVLAAIGRDEAGKAVLKELRAEKVSTGLVTQLQGFNTAYSAILTGFGADRIILTYGGATTHLGEERHVRWGMLKKAKWLHVSSFHSKPMLLKRILQVARRKGIGISFNPGMSEIRQGLEKMRPLLRNVQVLLLNRAEAGFLAGRKDVKGALKKLQAIVPLVVVTEDKRGVHAFDGEFYYFKPTYRVRIADTTGAGDAFHSGFVAALLHGKGVEKAMDWGTGNAHSVIMHLGAKNRLLSVHGVECFRSKHERKGQATRKRKMK